MSYNICSFLLVSLWICSGNPYPCYICKEEWTRSPYCSKLRDSLESKNHLGYTKLEPLSTSVDITTPSEPRGMHNTVDYSVTVEYKDLKEGILKHCHALLVQSVPSSFYVDQYEIQRLKTWDFAAYFRKNIDVELPEWHSQDEIALFYAVLQEDGKVLKAEFKIPWHSRYHSCSNDSEVTHGFGYIPSPSLYLSCVVNKDSKFSPNFYEYTGNDEICALDAGAVVAPCVEIMSGHLDLSESLCTWMMSAQNEHTIEVPVPVGQCAHGPFVMVVTLLVTSLGAGIICYYALQVALSRDAAKKLD